jgi:hypothetical protein
VVDTHVYSDADLDVEPPVMLSPVPFVTQNMTVELLISPTGEVRSARLMERPQQLTDGTVLQPAKLWKFRPATKEGRPVTYRYRLRLLAAAN